MKITLEGNRVKLIFGSERVNAELSPERYRRGLSSHGLEGKGELYQTLQCHHSMQDGAHMDFSERIDAVLD